MRATTNRATGLVAVATALALSLMALPRADAQEATPETLAAMDRVAAAAIDKASRSVVLIHVERTSASPRPLTGGERLRLGVRRWYDPRYFTRPAGPATGVVIAPGLVATSLWNLEGDGSIEIEAPDGRRYPATRAGRDENLRLVLLKVRGASLTPIQKSSNTVRVGRHLFLVSRTARNEPMATAGIVAGLKRERGDAFTHSAKTSYANSGGALVDMEGNLLGVSVRHSNRARQGQTSGVAFGARLDRITPNLTALAGGKVIPLKPVAFLGISMDPRFTGEGVRILRVLDSTGAKAAGIKDGDVVLIFNSMKIKHFHQLREEIQKLEVGKAIVVTVKRGTEEIDYKVTLGARPEDRR